MIRQRKFVVEVHELLFVITFLFTYTSISIGGINLSDKILLIVITGIFFLKHIYSCSRFIVNQCILYVIFMAFGLLGVIFLSGKARILFFDFNYMLQLMLLTVFVYVFSRHHLDYIRFLKMIYHISVFTGIVGILQYFFWEPVTRVISVFVEAVYDNSYAGSHRIGSLYDNPNLFAGMLVCMSLLGLLFWFESSKRKYLYGTGIMVIALLFTQTRSALLVLAVGILQICFLKQEGRQRIKSFELIILFGVAAQYVIAKGYLSRFRIFFSGFKNIELMTGRRNIIWSALLSQGTKNIFYGIGNGMSEIVTKNKIGQSFGPHSTYIGVLSETGIIGAIAFFLFLTMILVKGRKIKDKKLRHIFIVIYTAMILLQITESHLRAFMQFIILFWLMASIPFTSKATGKGNIYHSAGRGEL